MNWYRFTQVQNVPPSQAALALGMIGLGHAWVLYYPTIGIIIRPYLAFSGTLLLLPVLLKYLNWRTFIADLQHPVSGSLMAPMSMALLILCDYLAILSPFIAYPIWAAALLLHLTMMTLFFYFQLRQFKLANIVPSWFLYPVGVISSSLAGTQFGHTLFRKPWLTSVSLSISSCCRLSYTAWSLPEPYRKERALHWRLWLRLLT